MAVKTITIDMAACAVLSAEKRGNASFSKVIKRRLRPEHAAPALLGRTPGLRREYEAQGRMNDIACLLS